LKKDYFHSNQSRVIARFALAIKAGQTNLFLKIILEWMEAFDW
jgi:hypothetical protein